MEAQRKTTRTKITQTALSQTALTCPQKGQTSAVISLRAVTRCFHDASPASTTTDLATGSVEKLAEKHAEFGECQIQVVHEPPYFLILTTYISFFVDILSHFQDLLARWLPPHTTGTLSPRMGTHRLFGEVKNTLNMCSSEGRCIDTVEEAIYRSRKQMTEPNPGTIKQGFSTGSATNSTIFPALVERECLSLLEESSEPLTHRPLKEIIVTAEGRYSMEGNEVQPPPHPRAQEIEVLLLYRRGALDWSDRQSKSGVCDYFRVDPANLDGDYVAANQAVIDNLRCTYAGQGSSAAPALPILGQISSLRLSRTRTLFTGSESRAYATPDIQLEVFQANSKRLGFVVFGHDNSPIVPLMLYHQAKMPAFYRVMLLCKIPGVVVTYPTTLENFPARLCISAAHIKDGLGRV
ncbi:hypothetical protein BDW66DRAFT_167440 [Aspergillus desertorum]